MNGSGSIQFLPSDCFLSDAFVVFSQKVAVGHFSMFKTVTSFQGIPGTGFKPSRRDTAKGSKPQQRAAKPKQPPAPRRRWRESVSLISCCRLLLSFFFPLGFKSCCIVLRVANARDLIIDLRRLCYLQWITTQTDSDNGTVIRVRPYNLLYTFVTALKATAWCRVLIAQFGINFDAALSDPQARRRRRSAPAAAGGGAGAVPVRPP